MVLERGPGFSSQKFRYSHHITGDSGLGPIKLVVINPLDIGVGLEASHAVVR